MDQDGDVGAGSGGVNAGADIGGTRAHAAIQRNIALALGNRLRGKPCQFFGGDLKIAAAGSIRYPDGFVTRAPGASGDTVVHDPVVIFEVMSPSTAGTDAIVKNREYAATPSVRRYVLLAQDVVGGTMFERMGDDWIGHVLAPDSILAMPEIGVEAPIAEFYEGWSSRGCPPSSDRVSCHRIPVSHSTGGSRIKVSLKHGRAPHRLTHRSSEPC